MMMMNTFEMVLNRCFFLFFDNRVCLSVKDVPLLSSFKCRIISISVFSSLPKLLVLSTGKEQFLRNFFWRCFTRWRLHNVSLINLSF